MEAGGDVLSLDGWGIWRGPAGSSAFTAGAPFAEGAVLLWPLELGNDAKGKLIGGCQEEKGSFLLSWTQGPGPRDNEDGETRERSHVPGGAAT